ncbi:MAG: hypothetical protein HQL08_10475 [Nitrospirae bacterium]|nr:hypothetical protein [Nitrospirota bacterium]
MSGAVIGGQIGGPNYVKAMGWGAGAAMGLEIPASLFTTTIPQAMWKNLIIAENSAITAEQQNKKSNSGKGLKEMVGSIRTKEKCPVCHKPKNNGTILRQ